MSERKWHLQLFAEGGQGAPAAGGDSGQENGQTAPGVPAAQAGQAPQTEPAPGDGAARPSFEELLQDQEYKAAYDRRVRSAIANRFKAINAERERERQGAEALYTTLGRRYGMDVSDVGKIDVAALSERVMADDAFLEEMAAEQGLTTDGMRRVLRAESEANQARRAAAEQAERAEFRELLAEADGLKELYPQLDISAEMQNPAFSRLLRSLKSSGFPEPVRTAYESVHGRELMAGALRTAVQTTRQQVSNAVQSGAQRPRENGAAPAASSRFDPAHLTREQRKEIRERVRRGERISF